MEQMETGGNAVINQELLDKIRAAREAGQDVQMEVLFPNPQLRGVYERQLRAEKMAAIVAPYLKRDPELFRGAEDFIS
ncbi:hypothetical protein [Neisseria perflava]|uniref:hypothetical protein n=1 Tax=Neisseria perflava TaxID=33053 RepID=UPI0020A2030C|nr:hypothetical protein [Neisseria perflava]MCP1659300.1 hypothetical protein [Neisseria perflava]